MNDWKDNRNGTVTIEYDDGIVTVRKEDFDRSFGTIINSTKQDVERDFGIRKAEENG